MRGLPSSRTTSDDGGSRAASGPLTLTSSSLAHDPGARPLHGSAHGDRPSGHTARTFEPAPAIEEVEDPRMLARTEHLQEVRVHKTERTQTRDLGTFPVDQRGGGAR